MPAGIFTPGPVHIFARFRSNTIGFYLGTCVKAPDQDHEFYQIPIMNDLGGRSVPYQLIQDGENAIAVIVLNRFDMIVARGIRALPAAAGGGTVSQLGTESAYARGTLNIGLSDFELIFVNTYYNTPAAGQPLTAAMQLNQGRRYFSASLSKYKESTEGSRVLEIAMAIKLENTPILNPDGTQGFALYTETNLGQLGPVT